FIVAASVALLFICAAPRPSSGYSPQTSRTEGSGATMPATPPPTTSTVGETTSTASDPPFSSWWSMSFGAMPEPSPSWGEACDVLASFRSYQQPVAASPAATVIQQATKNVDFLRQKWKEASPFDDVPGTYVDALKADREALTAVTNHSEVSAEKVERARAA